MQLNRRCLVDRLSRLKFKEEETMVRGKGGSKSWYHINEHKNADYDHERKDN